MAWTKLPTVSVRYEGLTLRITRAGYDGPYLVIRIPRPLAAESGIPADEKSRVDLFLGEGSDAGRIKIEPRPDGSRRSQPVGKTGPVKIALPKPPGAPDDFATTTVEATVLASGKPRKGRGLTFPLPWHRPAADRIFDETTVVVEEAAPTTLDAVEEAARPMSGVFHQFSPEQQEAALSYRGPENHGDPAFSRAAIAAVARDVLADIEDKPVNGSARGHVYADSGEGQKIIFSHNGKSCAVGRPVHTLLTKLHAAMVKNPDGFLGDDLLAKATGRPNVDALHALVSVGRKAVDDMDLHIKRWPKLGYYMREVSK